MNEETINSIIRYNERATKEIERLKQEKNNLQSKLDKVNNYIDSERKKIQQHQYSTGIRRLNKIQDILKENNYGFKAI